MKMKLFTVATFLFLLGRNPVSGKTKNDQDPGFVCYRPSENEAGDFLDKIISYNYCLDSDPVPEAILTPSNLNLFMKSAMNGGALALSNLGGGLYAYGNGGYMGAFLVYDCPEEEDSFCPNSGRRGAILIDAPPALGAGLGKFLQDSLNSLDADLQMMIVTHEHNDHNGNLNAVLQANPSMKIFLASAETANKLQEFSNPSYLNPRVQEIYSSNPTRPLYPKEFDILIDDEFDELSVGNQTLTFRLVEGHGHGNLLIWHESTKTIINIDPPFEPKWSPFFEFELGNDIPSLFKLFDIYKEYPFDYFIAGHSSHVGTPEDIAVAEEYLVDILDAAFRSIEAAAADPVSFANFNNIAFNRVNVLDGVNTGNFFVAFREYYAQLNVMCADIVIDKDQNLSGEEWIQTLTGVRATVYSHCSTVMYSLLTDIPGTTVQ